MASSDWITVPNSLLPATVARGVTAGVDRPPGGGTHLYAWKGLGSGTVGVDALRVDVANFNPIPGSNGGQITFTAQKKAGDQTGFAVFAFFQLQADDVTVGDAYMLGISAGDPGSIILRKGTLVGGLPDLEITDPGILRKSVGGVGLDEWIHLRLDVISNPSGDVILKCFQNDLSVNDATAPIWVAIDGMADFNDDSLGINSGSPGLAAGGRMGIGFFMQTAGVIGAVDHVVVGRET